MKNIITPFLVSAILILLFAAISSPLIASSPITNYRSGISIGFSGQDEKDYVFECWYHDPLIDDHGVVYIKDSTQISLSHNERNTAWVYSKADSTSELTLVDPSKGVIRYKIDRDLNYRYVWANANTNSKYSKPEETFPAFTAPFSFQDLTYAPDDPSVKVVGTTGPKDGVALNDSLESRRNYYCRGMLDSFGDEWHIITVGDDDVGVDPFEAARGTEGRHACSDGKINYFIVNPKTPALFLTAASEKAQFYTTPIKNYFIPTLHEQTSYVTDGVEIHLVNIMSDAPVYYRWDKEDFKKYQGPIPVSALSDGEHALEYYYQDSHHRIRKIVKNPGYPSDKDEFAANGPKQGIHRHGYLLWRDDAEFQRLKDRLTGTSTSPDIAIQQARYKIFLNDPVKGNGQKPFDDVKRKGQRFPLYNIQSGDTPLINALVAQVEGLDKAQKYASEAKQMMFENELTFDQVGYELSGAFGCTPGDNFTCGYYKIRPQVAVALAYDLLITKFRAPAYADGFTPIEDLKIRDMQCNYPWILELHRGFYNLGYEWMNFWATSRSIGALVTAMAMPSYDTPYYGTSGFNGATTTHTGLPYPDQAATWYQLLYEDNVPKLSFPNQALDFGLLKSTVIPHISQGKEVSDLVDGCMDETGMSIIPRGVYNAFHVLGEPFGIYANIMKINFDKSWPWLDAYFEKCNTGTQETDEAKYGPVKPGYYPNPLVINEYFPQSIADVSLKTLKEKGDFKSQDIYALIFTHPDYASIPKPGKPSGNGP